MLITRFYESSFQAYLKNFPILLLAGHRGTGKTTLASKILPQAQNIQLQSPQQICEVQENPESFMDSLSFPAIIDNIHNTPQLLEVLKKKIGLNASSGQYILISHHNFGLHRQLIDRLLGTMAIIEVRTLSYLEAKRLIPELSEEDYILTGGFPAVYQLGQSERSQWFDQFYLEFLEKDLRQIKETHNVFLFDKLIRSLALRTAQPLNYAEIAQDCGVSANTIKSWITMLNTTGLIHLLKAYPKSGNQRLAKTPKLYFTDTGFLCHLLGLTSWEQVKLSPLKEALWETHVIGQWLKFFYAQGKRPPFWYWRTAYGDEIDLIFEQRNKFIGLSCSYSEKPEKCTLKGFQTLKKCHGNDALLGSYVACRTSKPFEMEWSSTKAIPGGWPFDITNLKEQVE